MYEAKKLAVVSAISLSVTVTNTKNTLRPLERLPCIHHLLQFRKNLRETRALIESSSEVNAITPAYIAELGLKVEKTNIGAQKIDGSTLNIFEMVLANFQMEDKLSRTQYFQAIFLVANTTLKVIFEIPFFTLSNTNI